MILFVQGKLLEHTVGFLADETVGGCPSGTPQCHPAADKPSFLETRLKLVFTKLKGGDEGEHTLWELCKH